jgi:hypothetical protein
MWNTYKSEQAAIAYLIGQGFAFNDVSGIYERGERFVSLARAIVGKCADGVWIITRA